MSLRSPFPLLAIVLALGAVLDCASMARDDSRGGREARSPGVRDVDTRAGP